MHYVAFIFLSKRAQEMSDRFCEEEAKDGGGWDGRKGEQENTQIYFSVCKKTSKLASKTNNDKHRNSLAHYDFLG